MVTKITFRILSYYPVLALFFHRFVKLRTFFDNKMPHDNDIYLNASVVLDLLSKIDLYDRQLSSYLRCHLTERNFFFIGTIHNDRMTGTDFKLGKAAF